MPKTKKKEPIKGIAQVPKDKLTVVKSNPLTSLWRSELTLSEFKILDVYLSRIDSHKPESRQVEITKEEFEEVFGISKFNLKELDARLEHLMKQAVRISDGTYKKGFAWVSLFEEARVDLSDNGVQTVYLECTQKAMKYFFNCDNLGYLRYKLQSIKNMKSRYTYVLFLYLEKNRFRTDWSVPLDELKVMLNCENDETYSEFKRFNEKILKRCQKEILEKTECRFDYTPVKKGRKVTAIRFTVYPLRKLNNLDINAPDQFYFEDIQENIQEDDVEFFRTACCIPDTDDPEFSREQMQQLFEVLVTLPDHKLPSKENLPIPTTTGQRYHYLRERYAAMNAVAEKKKITHRYFYFLAMIKKDAEK